MASHIYLHAGFHKTGTTALQHKLFSLAAQLRQYGFHYPTHGRKAHHREAWALSGRTWGWKGNGGKKVDRSKWKHLLKEIKATDENFIISSEFCSELNSTQISQVREDLGETPVTIIFTWRPLRKILTSSYQQYLKYGITATYDEWLESIFRDETKSITPTFWKRHSHDQVILNWANVFHKSNIHLVVSEASSPNLLFERFAASVGLPDFFPKTPISGPINRKLSIQEIALLRRINSLFPKDYGWRQYERFIRQGAFEYLSSQASPSDRIESLATPEWAMLSAEKVETIQVSRIRELGINIHGDLFDSSLPKTVMRDEPLDIPIDIAATAAIGMARITLEHWSMRELISEIYSRILKKIKNRLKPY